MSFYYWFLAFVVSVFLSLFMDVVEAQPGLPCNNDYDCLDNCFICNKQSRQCVFDKIHSRSCSALGNQFGQTGQIHQRQPQFHTFALPPHQFQRQSQAARSPLSPTNSRTTYQPPTLQFNPKWLTHPTGTCRQQSDCHDRCDLCAYGQCYHVEDLPGCGLRGGHDETHEHGHMHDHSHNERAMPAEPSHVHVNRDEPTHQATTNAPIDFNPNWQTHPTGPCSVQGDCHDRCDLCAYGQCYHVDELPGCAIRSDHSHGEDHDHDHDHDHEHPDETLPTVPAAAVPLQQNSARFVVHGLQAPMSTQAMINRLCPGGCGPCSSCTVRGSCVPDPTLPGCTG